MRPSEVILARAIVLRIGNTDRYVAHGTGGVTRGTDRERAYRLDAVEVLNEWTPLQGFTAEWADPS